MRHIARAFLALTLAASFVPTAHAAELTGVDAMTSTVLQEKQSSFSGLGIRARLHSAQLVPNVEMLPYIEWWKNTSTVQPFNIKSSRSDATVGFDVRYMGAWRNLRPYGGAGIGMHFLRNEVEAPSLGLAHGENSLIKGGPAFFGGATYALAGKLENFIEVKYHYVPSYSQFKIHMGLAWNLTAK